MSDKVTLIIGHRLGKTEAVRLQEGLARANGQRGAGKPLPRTWRERHISHPWFTVRAQADTNLMFYVRELITEQPCRSGE